MIVRVATANDVVPAFSPPVRFNRGVRFEFSGTGVWEAIITTKGGSPVMSHANYVHRGNTYTDNWAK